MGAHSLRLASVARGLAAVPRSEVMTASDARLREAVEQHLDLVWRVLRRAGLAAADAEDASQDVFWVLAQRLDAVPERAQRSFLVSTALRVASDRKRSRWYRSVRTGLEPDEYAGEGLGADEQLDLRRGAALLDRALAMLDEEDRAVYVLAELEQLSRSEVSEALAIPQGTVATRLKRARDACLAAVRRLHRGGARDD
jgi:RNA polymerase sigma-70 factor, ECF subfamily